MLDRMKKRLAWLAVFGLGAFALSAQTTPPAGDDTVLKQIIIFGRHGVRSAALPSSTLSSFAVRPYPDFGVPTGYLTVHGRKAQYLLGRYYRQYLLQAGLLSGNAQRDANRSYFRANSIQRSNVSAAMMAQALLPGIDVLVYSYPLGTPDPVFDPIATRIVTANGDQAAREIAGIYGTGDSLKAAYGAELSLIRSLLFGYPNGTVPPPPTPAGLVDATALPVPLTPTKTGVATANIIDSGAIANTLYAADPFVMEYTDGLPMSDVAWGELSVEALSQQTRIINLLFGIEMLPPYLNRLQSSNAASHVLRSMEQAAIGDTIPGAFGDPKDKLLVVNSSDAYVAGLAGLLHMHWLLPGYQQDYCAPGGSLVFELRERKRSGNLIVRAFYTAQTFDQLRNLTPLTLERPPATMQLFIPGGSRSEKDLDITFERFRELLRKAIDESAVQDPSTETPPGSLTGVPLQ